MLKKVLLISGLLSLSEMVFAPTCWDIFNPSCWDIFNLRGTTAPALPTPRSPSPARRAPAAVMCAVCGANPVYPGSRTCSRTCQTRLTSGAHTPRPPAPALPTPRSPSPARRAPATVMCAVCGANPVYPGSRTCSRNCQRNLSRAPAPRPTAQLQYNSMGLQYLIGTNSSRQQVPFYTFWHTHDNDTRNTPLYPQSWDPKDLNQCFSNWYPSVFNININGEQIIFPTAEHAIMFYKVLHQTGDINVAKSTILYTDTASSVKRKARPYYNASWDIAKINYARLILAAKFGQNQNLMNLLKSTRGGILVEASPIDKDWGVGLDQNNPTILNFSTWNGRNILGDALMFVRDN